MEEEKKTTQVESSESGEEKKLSEILRMIGKILIGLVLVVLGGWAFIGWFSSVKVVFKGCIGLFLILTGLIFFAIARD